MEGQDPKDDRSDRNVELPGDTNSSDIVGRSGEEMPLQSHDGVGSDEGGQRGPANEQSPVPVRADDDNPRGRVAD